MTPTLPFPVTVDGDEILEPARRAARQRLDTLPLPSTEAEEWRYSPIGDFDPSRFSASAPSLEDRTGASARRLAALVDDPAVVVLCANGRVWSVSEPPAGVTVERAAEGVRGPAAMERSGADAFVEWNTAQADPVVVRIDPNVEVERPIVVVDWLDTDGSHSAFRLIVEAGEHASATVVELHGSEDVTALSVAVTDLDLGAGARLHHRVVEDQGDSVWHLGSVRSTAARDAVSVVDAAVLGGGYARLRFDTALEGSGAHGELGAVYVGDGERRIDLRTFQDHLVDHTTSDLNFRGAVDGSAEAVYTGLIRIHEGARGSDANQTNRILNLGDDAWAESVPNLEIHNNDVRCSHASAVGPIDADQRFYLETRGVEADVADRLIVEGFLTESLHRFEAPALVEHLRERLLERLASEVPER